MTVRVRPEKNHPLRVEPLGNPMHILANLTALNHVFRIFASPVSGKCFYSVILLSIKFDPFIVTVYLRRGRFGGMSRRDWQIFLLSWLIGMLSPREPQHAATRPNAGYFAGHARFP